MKKRRDPVILFRDDQIALLTSLFRHPGIRTIHISGPPSACKKTTVMHVLKQCNVPVIRMHCVDGMSVRMLFAEVLRQLARILDREVTEKAVNFSKFLDEVRDLMRGADLERVCVVLQNAECLRGFGPHFWSSLMKFSELLGDDRVAIVTISTLDRSKFDQGTAVRPEVEVVFPGYDRDQISKIITTESRAFVDIDLSELFDQYCRFMIDTFFKLTACLTELRFLVSTHWSKFLEPVGNGEHSADDFRKLWKAFEPTVSLARANLFTRDQTYLTNESGSSRDREMMDLPFISKYLLIAAYLASHNPPKSDKRYFVKYSAKKKTKAKAPVADLKFAETYKTLGPKLFPLGRLKAILFVISDGTFYSTTQLDLQIAALERMNLLVRVRSVDPVSGVKFKCAASFDLISKLATNLQFDIGTYLFRA